MAILSAGIDQNISLKLLQTGKGLLKNYVTLKWQFLIPLYPIHNTFYRFCYIIFKQPKNDLITHKKSFVGIQAKKLWIYSLIKLSKVVKSLLSRREIE